MSNYEGRWTTVKVEIEEGIAWVILIARKNATP